LVKSFKSAFIEIFLKEPSLKTKIENLSSFFAFYFQKIQLNLSLNEIIKLGNKTKSQKYFTSIQNLPIHSNILSLLEQNLSISEELPLTKQKSENPSNNMQSYNLQNNISIYTNTWKSGKTLLSKIDLVDNGSKERNLDQQMNTPNSHHLQDSSRTNKQLLNLKNLEKKNFSPNSKRTQIKNKFSKDRETNIRKVGNGLSTASNFQSQDQSTLFNLYESKLHIYIMESFKCVRICDRK
jgi:hypothetical protein